jgi:TolB-like protein
MRDEFRLGDWLIEPSLVRISKPGKAGHVRAKVMDLLVYFAQHAGEVIPKAVLLQDVWGTDSISESALTRTIAELRQAFGDDVDEPTILETIPRRGYRLIATVAEAPRAEPAEMTRLAGAPPDALDEHRSVRSIAVLPFTDMSAARDHDWLCEGIAEEILNALLRLPGLHVVTRTSAFRFKDPARDVRRIGETLGVTTLLEGSVRTAGPQLRVTAQLVNASDGYELWSQRFDRRMEDVFAIQDEIARKVVEALEVGLARGSAARHSSDLSAYHLFLKGRYFRYTKLDLVAARRSFDEAIHRDPAYALARIALAETLIISALYGLIPPSVGHNLAKAELCAARSLNDRSGDALGLEALAALLHDWDTRAAIDMFERALETDPASIPVRCWYTWALIAQGRSEEAVEHARRIADGEPQSAYANAMAGFTYLQASRVEEAITLERRAVEIAPDSLQANWLLGLALAGGYIWDQANEWFSRAVERSARAPIYLGMLAWCQAASGSQDEARRTLSELDRRASVEYVSPVFASWAFSELGDVEKARALLRDAFAERASVLAVQTCPWFRQLRSDPLMEDLHRRLLMGGPTSVPDASSDLG